jgi:dolichyl-phosphate beta-glucosyltransferase
VPVNWADQPGSKVRLIRDGLAMLRELLTIHSNAEKGFYSDRVVTRELSPLASSSAVLD